MSIPITRRAAMQTLAAASAAIVCPDLIASSSDPDKEFAAVAKKVYPKQNWSYTELNEFLRVLPEKGIKSMGTALELSSGFDPEDRNAAITAIKKQIVWSASHFFTYPFKDHEKIPYHDIVQWAAKDIGVDSWIVQTQPTLVIERAILEKLFVDIWDKLTPEQRQEYLKELSSDNSIRNAAAIASLSGAGALAALALSVHLAGFAFYTTMSSFICAAAAFMGVTLPFAAYTASSAIVAFLAGPVGWLFIAVAAAASIASFGNADVKKTAAAICQLHLLKVAALQAAGGKDETVFSAVGDPIRRQLVGKWRVRGQRETIEYLFAGDGTFLATCFRVPREEGGEAELSWRGNGKWYVDEHKLTVRRTHTEGWLWDSVNERMMYDKRKILEITPLELRLDGNAVLERL